MPAERKPRRVIVTAAGAGLGLVVAKSFRATGDNVAICDVDATALARFGKEHPQALAQQVDLADEKATGAFMRKAIEQMGGVDILVNNGGIAGPTGPLEAGDPAAIERCLQVCLLSQFWTLRQALPAMKAQKSGLIVNISSTAGLFGYPLRTPYAAAKWGVIGLTKSLAMEVGPDRIRVNAICPGSLTGERMERVIAAEAKARHTTTEEIYRGVLKGVSLRTFISPEEIAGMIHYLASPAGRAITGQAISVDGGTETLATT
jgi:NAD(P)-dependent dehydrogenase (short-subunit alcohol dehydrogenase family)